MYLYFCCHYVTTATRTLWKHFHYNLLCASYVDSDVCLQCDTDHVHSIKAQVLPSESDFIIMFTQFGFSVFTLHTCFVWTLNCVRTQPSSYRQARWLFPVSLWAVFWSRGFIRLTHKQIRRRWFKPSSVSYDCFLWWGNSRLILWDTDISLKILIYL